MKALKSYGLKFKELKVVVGDLNESGLLDKNIAVVGVKGEAVLVALLDAIDLMDAGKLSDMPASVTDFYEALPQEVLDDLPKGSEARKGDEAEEATETETDEAAETETDEAAGEDELTSECPVFKTGWNPKEDDCKSCAKDFPDEHAACEKATTAAKKKGGKKKGTGAPTGIRTRYGHVVGSMSGDVDDMVWEGSTLEDMTKALVKKHKRTEAKARAKVRGHMMHLTKNKDITISENKKGIFKAKQKYAEGYTAKNTQAS